MIHVLVVEDVLTSRKFLTQVLSSDPHITVVGSAENGEEALEAVRRFRPDVVTMDIHMPKMDGYEATRKIMESCPTPIVIVAGTSIQDQVAATFRAMESGALAVVMKPEGLEHPQHEAMASELIRTVKLMSEVKVIRRWARHRFNRSSDAGGAEPIVKPKNQEIKCIAMGASTGGPLVLQAILSKIPKNFSIPILIVQHMASGFVEGFVEWLSQSTPVSVQLAKHRETPEAGRVYVAPDKFQMKVDQAGRILLAEDPPENGLRPSVSYLFRSMAEVFGKSCAGILLTGMGKDGAEELKLMKEHGALTIVQSQASCAVFGMPGEAVSLGAASLVLSPEKIAEFLQNLNDHRGHHGI